MKIINKIKSNQKPNDENYIELYKLLSNQEIIKKVYNFKTQKSELILKIKNLFNLLNKMKFNSNDSKKNKKEKIIKKIKEKISSLDAKKISNFLNNIDDNKYIFNFIKDKKINEIKATLINEDNNKIIYDTMEENKENIINKNVNEEINPILKKEYSYTLKNNKDFKNTKIKVNKLKKLEKIGNKIIPIEKAENSLEKQIIIKRNQIVKNNNKISRLKQEININELLENKKRKIEQKEFEKKYKPKFINQLKKIKDNNIEINTFEFNEKDDIDIAKNKKDYIKVDLKKELFKSDIKWEKNKYPNKKSNFKKLQVHKKILTDNGKKVIFDKIIYSIDNDILNVSKSISVKQKPKSNDNKSKSNDNKPKSNEKTV